MGSIGLPSIPRVSHIHRPLNSQSSTEVRWLRAGYILTAVLLVIRLGYLASNFIELSNDEAYQWLWSKHLALSYYSKPPGIALLQFAGTSLWGDTEFGVRFFAPVTAAVLSVVVLRFMAREAGARQGFLLLLIITSAPLMSAGSILMTIDPPLVLCWTLALIMGWRAVQPDGTTNQWLLTGLASGLAFLFKFSAAYLVVCFAAFFVLWPPARMHLRKPGPYLALLLLLMCTLPTVIWNSQHQWVTVQHVSENAGMGPKSKWHPTLRFFWDFFFIEALLLNPVFFLGALWAMATVWKRRSTSPLELYLFCTGGLVFFGHWVYSLHSRILPNWIAPTVLPMYCAMVIYWDERWREGARAVRGWLIGGLILGLGVVAVAHDTDIIGKIAGRPLPGDMDPLRRVRGYEASAEYVEQARQKLLQDGKKPVFIICHHYGLAGLISFYLPEAKKALITQPLVYCELSNKADSQFYFWPEYRYVDHRRGENAIYVAEPGAVYLGNDWLQRWLTGKEVPVIRTPPPVKPPTTLSEEFDSVTDLGVKEIKVDGRTMKRVQLFECRNLH